MIAVNVYGQDCWLLNHFPNAPKSVRLGLPFPVDDQRGLTGGSSRRPGALTLRTTLEWTSVLRAADFAALRAACLAAQDEHYLAPLWPHAIRVGADTATITSGLTIAWTDGWVTWAINPVSLVGYDFAAPLLFGYLTQPPRPGAINDDSVTCDLFFEEDSTAGYAIAPAGGVLAADTTFNTAGGFAAPIFPFLPFESQPGVAVVDVERMAIGGGRQKATTFFPQSPEQLHAATVLLKNAHEAAQMIEWWRRRAGTTEPHWMAQSQALGRLSADAASGSPTLNFSSLHALSGNPYLALFDPAGQLEIGRRTASTSTQITLAANLTHSWKARWTTVAPAMLARHTGKELTLEYTPAGTGWMAKAKLNWREVAPEYAPPAGETRGTTLGRLPALAKLFLIELDYNGAIASTRLTNWESGATVGGHDWTYNACDYDKLIRDIDLQEDSCTFTMRWYAGCPWENWMPGQLAATGHLTIFHADVDSAGAFSNFSQKWKGKLGAPAIDGAIVKARVVGANALFSQRAPRQLMSPFCGTQLFSPRCGLALGDWTFNAVITAIAGNVVTIGTITRAIGGGLPSGFGAVDWFALGWMGWVVGGNLFRDGVLSSTALSGGHIELTLERAVTLTVGTSVTAVPGCDRLGATCREKFDNYDNFQGFEFMPAVSPNFIIPQRNTTSKK